MRWIVTDNIYNETWRPLLEFSNADLVVDRIVHFHGDAKTKVERDNYKKQAKQARVCVLQAKEYFDAARASSVFTSPNHCYYGAISLASLALLVLGDGSKSLDFLRKDNANNHHGLDFTIGCNASSASKGITLLEESRAEILSHGHFFNFYNTLPKFGEVNGIVRSERGSTFSLSRNAIGRYDVAEFSTIIGRKKTLIELLRTAPDLADDLTRFGISFPHSFGIHEVTIHENGFAAHKWRLHDCHSDADRERLLEHFSADTRTAGGFHAEVIERTTSAIVFLRTDHSEPRYSFPDSRETLNHDTIYYANKLDDHEIIDLYMVSYQLSMLSRYFPDVWINCVESQCKAAKLIERAVDIIIKKFPILVLSALNHEDTVISASFEFSVGGLAGQGRA
jgi:hypothetical protein